MSHDLNRRGWQSLYTLYNAKGLQPGQRMHAHCSSPREASCNLCKA